MTQTSPGKKSRAVAVCSTAPQPARPPHAIQPRLPFAKAPRPNHVTIIATGSPAWQARTPACYHSNQARGNAGKFGGKKSGTTGKVLARARPPRGRPTPRLRGLPVPRGKRAILCLRLLPSTTGSGVAVPVVPGCLLQGIHEARFLDRGIYSTTFTRRDACCASILELGGVGCGGCGFGLTGGFAACYRGLRVVVCAHACGHDLPVCPGGGCLSWRLFASGTALVFGVLALLTVPRRFVR